MNAAKQDPHNLALRGMRWGQRSTWAREVHWFIGPDEHDYNRWTWTVALSVDGSIDRMVRRAVSMDVAAGVQPSESWRKDVARHLRAVRAANRADLVNL